tara:strand:- start:49 stop:420 length:372 start_codon:yes stop_codon:yes gene_type:complete
MNTEIIDLMVDVVGVYTNTRPATGPLTDVGPHADVFLLSKEDTYGHEIIAITDGGRSKIGMGAFDYEDIPIKYVKWFNHRTKHRGAVQQDASLIIKDKTWSFSHKKATAFWETKIKEGFKRVR